MSTGAMSTIQVLIRLPLYSVYFLRLKILKESEKDENHVSTNCTCIQVMYISIRNKIRLFAINIKKAFWSCKVAMTRNRNLEAETLNPRSRHHHIKILLEPENTSSGSGCSTSTGPSVTRPLCHCWQEEPFMAFSCTW